MKDIDYGQIKLNLQEIMKEQNITLYTLMMKIHLQV